MKYGLIVYDEQNAQWRNGEIYTPSMVNIGDYIQSIAARQFLPSVDTFVEREQIHYFSSEPTKVIMNGWWRIFDGCATTSSSIIPLYISYHISRTDEVRSETLAHLKKYEPIGCRDYYTMYFLQANGVAAFFSACLTLTLGKTYKRAENASANPIVFADFFEAENSKPDEKSVFLEEYLASVIRYNPTSIERLQHSLPIRHTSHETRFEIADSYLQKFSSAALVVTSRIHAALPCLAMGTPVLFCFKKYDAYRYKGILDFFNYIGFIKDEFVYDYTVRKFSNQKFHDVYVINPNAHIPYADNISVIVENFINSKMPYKK